MSVLPTSVWLNDNTPLFQPYGSGGGSTVSTFTTLAAETASISSLTVSSINGVVPGSAANWANFPAVNNVNMNGSNIQAVSGVFGSGLGAGTNPLSVDAGNINTLNLNGSNIDIASYSPAGKISFTNSFAEIGSITPAGLTINAIGTSSINASSITTNTFTAISTVNVVSTISTTQVNTGLVNTNSISSGSAFVSSLNTNAISSGKLLVSDLSTTTLTTSNINTSTINGNELIVSTIVLESTIQAEGGSFSNLSAQAFSTIGASIQQGLMSSIVFNPSISPQFNVDLGMGNFLATLGAGLFGVAVAVPTTAGTITYGLTKGLASLFEQKPVNNINSNIFEVYNYQTQLQTSTLGNQVSTIYSFLSTIPSTVVINTSNINSTVSEVAYPFYYSTLSGPNPTCMRSIADPVQTVSTPWTYEQGFGQWVEIPAAGLGSNISTLGLSTLQLLPSTVLKGDLNGAILEVFESGTSNYGEVQSAGYWVSLSPSDPNYGILARATDNNPVWIDSNVVANRFALQGKSVTFSNVVTLNPDLDEWALLKISTVTGGGLSTTQTLMTTRTTNFGQLLIGAPDTSQTAAQPIITLDSASTCVGILNTSPQCALDVGGLNYTSPTSLAVFGGSRDGTLEVTLQNKSGGSNASAFFFAVENTGGEYAGFGVNSLNLSSVTNTLFEIPGASIQSGTVDCVIGPQSDHSSNSGIYLTYKDGAFAHHINSNGALSFNATYSNNILSEGDFGTAGNLLVSGSSGSNPTWASNIGVNQIGVSTLAVNGYLDFGNTIFTGNTDFIVAGANNQGVWTTNVQISPVDELNFIRGMTNSTITNGYICLAPRQGLMGVNKVPDAGNVLDVGGYMAASNISTPQAIVSSIIGDNVSSAVLNVASAAISSISQPVLLDSIPHSTCTLIGSQNWDFFVNSWGAYNGKQAVQGGYFITTTSSIGSGQGFGQFIFPPPGLSSLQSFSGTYFTNSSNPGFNTPIWCGNATPGANGNVSTINVYGDINADIMFSYLGYI